MTSSVPIHEVPEGGAYVKEPVIVIDFAFILLSCKARRFSIGVEVYLSYSNLNSGYVISPLPSISID